MAHLSPGLYPDPEGALLTDADLIFLGFTDDSTIDPFQMAPADHVLDARHEALLIYRDGQNDPPLERPS